MTSVTIANCRSEICSCTVADRSGPLRKTVTNTNFSLQEQELSDLQSDIVLARIAKQGSKMHNSARNTSFAVETSKRQSLDSVAGLLKETLRSLNNDSR